MKSAFQLMRLSVHFTVILFFSACDSDQPINDAAAKNDTAYAEYANAKASNQNRLDRIGAYQLLSTDESTKCNLVKGSFALENPVTDSADLAFLVKHLAFELFTRKVPQPDCSYPIMSQAFIYADTATFRKLPEDYVAMCTISEKKLTGEIFVNTNKLNALKSEKQK